MVSPSQPKNIMMSLGRYIMPRRSSTGTSNVSYNTKSTSSTSSSAIAKSVLLNDKNKIKNHGNGNGNTSIGHQAVYENDPSQTQQQQDNLNNNKNKKSRRRSRRRQRRHTMDHHQIADESTAISFQSGNSSRMSLEVDIDGVSNINSNSNDRKSKTGILSRFLSDRTLSTGSGSRSGSGSGDTSRLTEDGIDSHERNEPEELRKVMVVASDCGDDQRSDVLTSASPNRSRSHSNTTSSSIILASSPKAQTLTQTQTPTKTTPKTKTKQRRRSSLARAASTVLATSRNWLSVSATRQNQTQNEDGNDISDSIHTPCCTNAANTQSQSPRNNSDSSGSDDHCNNELYTHCCYSSEQTRLQALARETVREETIGRAIEYWEQSLELAETNRDYSSLSSVTEILCMLVNLHFQENERLQQLGKEDDDSSSVSSSSLHSLSLEEAVTMPLKQEQQQQWQSSSSDNEAAYHKREAQQYVYRIKYVMVQPTWLSCDLSLMEFLCETEAWELALIVANKLLKESESGQREEEEEEEGEETGKGSSEESEANLIVVSPQKLATLHYHIASRKLDSHKQGEALQHLQSIIHYLQQISVDQRDMTMYLQVLQLLAAEYQQQGQSKLALKAYEEQRNHAPSEQYAHISSQMAEIYISDGRLDMALEELESAHDQHYRSNDNNGDGTINANDNSSTMCAIRLQLLQTKGDVYCRLGRMDESMQVYQQALQEAQNPAEMAKLLYIMGRLCIRMGRTPDAISCFMHELELTERELGAHHLSVSVIYHELAKLYDEGLGLHKMAIQKYNKALQIELAVMEDLHFTAASCNKCDRDIVLSHRMCDTHANIHTQVQGQIRETKKCLGRIHFKLGDFDGALKASLSK